MGWIQCNRRAEMGRVRGRFEGGTAPRFCSLGNAASQCRQRTFVGRLQPAGIIAGRMISLTHPPIAQSTPRESPDLPLSSPPDEEGLDELLFEPKENGCAFFEDE